MEWERASPSTRDVCSWSQRLIRNKTNQSVVQDCGPIASSSNVYLNCVHARLSNFFSPVVVYAVEYPYSVQSLTVILSVVWCVQECGGVGRYADPYTIINIKICMGIVEILLMGNVDICVHFRNMCLCV